MPEPTANQARFQIAQDEQYLVRLTRKMEKTEHPSKRASLLEEITKVKANIKSHRLSLAEREMADG